MRTCILTDDMTDAMHKNEYKSASSNGQSQSGHASPSIRSLYAITLRLKRSENRQKIIQNKGQQQQQKRLRRTKVVSRVFCEFAFEANAF